MKFQQSTFVKPTTLNKLLFPVNIIKYFRMDGTSILYIGVTLLAGLILFIITQKKKPKERGKSLIISYYYN